MAKRDEDIRKFRRAAGQRLNTARFLLEHEFFLEAIYLAGYSVECNLKHLILKRTPSNQHRLMYANLTQAGAKGHDLEYLKNILRAAPVNCNAPRQISELLQRVSTWSTELRYEVGKGRSKDAYRFLDAAQEIAAWVERS